jgi:hypothetical protein
MGNATCKPPVCKDAACAIRGADDFGLQLHTEAVQKVDEAFTGKSPRDVPSAPQESGLDEVPLLGLDVPLPPKAPMPGEEFSVILKKDKSNNLLGLDADITSDDNCLPIRRVTGGLAEEWNNENPVFAIVAGDRIVSVNGLRADATQLTHRCASDNMLEFVLVRGENMAELC